MANCGASPREPQVGADARCDEREPHRERRPKGQVKALGECHGDEEGKAEGNEDEHLPGHPRDGGEVGCTQVHEGVYGEDHQGHGEDHVGYSRITTCYLADRDDEKPCDDTVHDEFDHGSRWYASAPPESPRARRLPTAWSAPRSNQA